MRILWAKLLYFLSVFNDMSEGPLANYKEAERQARYDKRIGHFRFDK